MLPPESTPNLSADPERDPLLRDALRQLDTLHHVGTAAVQRLDTRLMAALAEPAAHRALHPATDVAMADDDTALTTAGPLSLVSGIVLCAQQARRWMPVSVVAAAAAVLVAVSMTPSQGMRASSMLVAYAGGKAGAELIVDDLLGLQNATASALTGARSR